MGQYVHGNQPMQHVVYLYNFASAPWKSQYWVREIMDRLYNSGPAGYCGDEDTGQTSAWYIFSALGFYPVAPGTDQYVFGSPLFKKVIVKLPNGKTLTINAPQNSAANRYIASMTVNGKNYTKNWVSHKTLTDGATIDMKMTNTPVKNRGVADADLPYSFSTDPDNK
jgi:predicted alpha-1,2-mannosidase